MSLLMDPNRRRTAELESTLHSTSSQRLDADADLALPRATAITGTPSDESEPATPSTRRTLILHDSASAKSMRRRSSVIDSIVFQPAYADDGTNEAEKRGHAVLEDMEGQEERIGTTIMEENIEEESNDFLAEINGHTNWKLTRGILGSEADLQAQRESARSSRSIETRTDSWHTARSSLFGGWNRISKISSTTSFFSARSVTSSRQQSLLIEQSRHDISPWKKTLRNMDLLVDASCEQNWSGRGQHAEFDRSEKESIPLVHEKYIGQGAYAKVDSVRCRRIRLARKTIRCYYRLKKEDAIQEVKHIQGLSHTHIIRLIGTYVCGVHLGILLYPVAEYSLDTFLEEFHDSIEIVPPPSSYLNMRNSIRSFYGCLAKALEYLHKNVIKHMDIKPKNILIKDMGSNGVRQIRLLQYVRYKIIIADFGIAHSYAKELDADTNSPTAFTRTYAAPEVVEQSKRGLSVDIFSLGCVYLEIFSALIDSFTYEWKRSTDTPWNLAKPRTPILTRDHFQDSESQWDALFSIRTKGKNMMGDGSYQANLDPLDIWLGKATESFYELARTNISQLHRPEHILEFRRLVSRMLAIRPIMRPSAMEVCNFFGNTGLLYSCCCDPRPDPLEVIKD